MRHAAAEELSTMCTPTPAILVVLISLLSLSCASSDGDPGRKLRLPAGSLVEHCPPMEGMPGRFISVRVPPRYPERAFQAGVMGVVLMEFDIDSEGRPENIRVVEAEPLDVFDDAAVASLSRSRYCPQQFGDRNVRTALRFSMEQER